MDPHSRLSQFNQRVPKSGPQSLSTRFVDLMAQSKPSPHSFSKQSTSKKPLPAQSTGLIIRRPIATNSRVKQNEKLRKDMYLAFVNNALQQKTNGISEAFDELVDHFNPKQTLGEGVTQLSQLRFWILALSHVVSQLERTHYALVEAIVNMPWMTLDTATVKSYIVFTGMLLSARPEYLSLVLGKIAHGFTHQSGMQVLGTAMPEGSSTPLTRRIIYDRLHYLLRHLLSLIPTLPSTLQPLLVRNFPHKRQNQVAQSTYIRNILRVSSYCPELADKILATIIDRAIQIDVEIQVELEELEEQETTQDQDVFEIDPFDTVIGQDGEESDSDIDENDEGDYLSDLSSDAGEMDDQTEAVEVSTNVKHIQEMVKKLDAILTLIFDHFDRTYSLISTSEPQKPLLLLDLPPLPPLTPIDSPLPTPISSPVDLLPISQATPMPADSVLPRPPTSSQFAERNEKALLRTQFHTLLSIFDRTILRTFKSRYTQFLIFWYTSLDPEFADIFQGMLVDRALFHGGPTEAPHNATPPVTRAAAASYIGSFVSRATFVDREGARRIVGVLCEFLGTYMEGLEEFVWAGMSSGGGMTQHTVFYAVTQAVFLIFCFRWRDLQVDQDGAEVESLIGTVEKSVKKWMPELSILRRVIISVLNPLRVCSPNVVIQFARIAHATDFIYCYTILESNKRSEYRSNNADGRVRAPGARLNSTVLGGGIDAELNTFFPFDPYRLPKSSVYIQGVYREWSSVAIDDEDEDEEAEDEDEQIEEQERNDLVPSVYLDIPRSDTLRGDDGGQGDENSLGESLGAMSISPVRHAVAKATHSPCTAELTR